MVLSEMLHRVALLRTDVSEKLSASIIRVTRICEIETMLPLTSNRRFVFHRSVRRLLVTANVVPTSPILFTMIMEVLRSTDTSVLTKTTRCNISDNAILHGHRRENVKPYIYLQCLNLYPEDGHNNYIRNFLLICTKQR
jgi:hypothetical protein